MNNGKGPQIHVSILYSIIYKAIEHYDRINKGQLSDEQCGSQRGKGNACKPEFCMENYLIEAPGEEKKPIHCIYGPSEGL